MAVGVESVTPVGSLMIGVVPFVVRNGGYWWGERRLVVSGVQLLLPVEADCSVGVFSHNPSGRRFEPHPLSRLTRGFLVKRCGRRRTLCGRQPG